VIGCVVRTLRLIEDSVGGGGGDWDVNILFVLYNILIAMIDTRHSIDNVLKL